MQTDDRRQSEFLEMLRQHEGFLLKVCLVFGGRGREDFKDLYQEIALNLWESWKFFRGESDPGTWVVRIALNVAGQELRRRKNRPQFVEFDERFYDLLADEATDERYHRLYDLIDRLGDDERKLLFLYLDRKSLREIAAITGGTEVGVKQKIHRIKKKLSTLKQQEDE